MTFDRKQRFSIRKYSIGVASVLLGTLVVGGKGNDLVHANEVESTDSGLETLAPEPDVVVEVTQEAHAPEAAPAEHDQATLESVARETQELSDQTSLSMVSENKYATTTTSEIGQEGSVLQASSEVFLAESVEQPVQNPSAHQEVSGLVESLEMAHLEQTSTTSEASDKPLTLSVTASEPLASMTTNQASNTADSVTTLTNAMAAALVEMRRNGDRQTCSTDSNDLSLKMSAVTARGLLEGYFVDWDYIENLKIGKDYSGMPWAYDFKVENPTYKNPLTGNSEPQIHYEAHVPMTRLGTIDFVDDKGQPIAGITDKVTFNNASNQIQLDGHSYVAIYDAGLTKLPPIPAGYSLKYPDSKDKTKVQAYVDILESTPQYNYTDSISQEDLSAPDYSAPSPQALSSSVWTKGQKQIVTLIQQADGSYALDPSIQANDGKVLAPGYRYHLVIEASNKDIEQNTSQTVIYQGAGDKTPASKVQDSFTFTGKENQVTSHQTWDQTSHAYGREGVPLISGYFADKAQAGGLTVTPDQPKVTDTVTYQALGKIIPVDEDGRVIKGAPTLVYANDISDPTKAAETTVPLIVGYTATMSSVTPSHPGQDTSVIYIKDDQKASVLYLDETTGQQLAEDHLSGKSGDLITYSTADKIAYYQDRGYALVKVDFPRMANFDNDRTVDQVFTVTLKHDTVELGQKNAQPSGELINPKDPDSPTWPDQATYEKNVTFTVSYLSADQQAQLPSDKLQTAQWTRTLTLDKVTGQVLSATDWSSDKAKYDMVISPVVSGYFVDKAVVASKAVTQDNSEEIVTYFPLGRIIAVDEKGNPIPNAPSPRYNNDPNDPTKASLTMVPEIPGYRAEKVSVSPESPGQDSIIVYKPITPSQPVVNQEEDTITIIYRDEAGNQIRMPRIISSAQGRVYDQDEDRYINRNGVIYERIRQEGDGSKGRRTITYIYRRVDNPTDQVIASASSQQGGRFSGQTSHSVKVDANESAKDTENQEKQVGEAQERLPQAGDEERGTLGFVGLLLMILSLIPGLSWLRKDKA